MHDYARATRYIKAAAKHRCQHCAYPDTPHTHRALTIHFLDGDHDNWNYANLLALCHPCSRNLQDRFLPNQLPLPGVNAYPWSAQLQLPEPEEP